jgi:hypothetical protein
MLTFLEFHIPESEDDEETKPLVPVKQLVDLTIRDTTLRMNHGPQLIDLVVRDSTIRVVHDIRLDMGSWKGVAIGTLIGMFIASFLQLTMLLI